jgi:hypothetical protein
MAGEMHEGRRDDAAQDRWFTLPVREYATKVVVTSIVAAVGLFLIFRELRDMGLGPTELSMSPTGMSVKLGKRIPNGVEYFVVVAPQMGWQDTDIKVAPTDEVEFWASGQVNLSIFRINESVIERRAAEARINCLRDGGAPASCTDARARTFADSVRRDTLLAPEALFTPEERRRMQPRQPWLGPEGDSVTVDRSYTGRTAKKLAPRLPYGRLIGLVLPTAEEPITRDTAQARRVFGIGRTRVIKGAQRDTVLREGGDLWLAVNDVWNGPPNEHMETRTYPDNLFMADNVGFFWVRVRITRD